MTHSHEAGTGHLVPAAYPMVDEADATGRVASIYAEILERRPMVPSLFKSLAACPTYLELAWRQTLSVLDDDRASQPATRLVDLADGAVPPPHEQPVCEVLSRFVDPLSRMLLVSAGLRLALDGALDAPPAELGATMRPERPRPELNVPPTGQLDATLAGAIRRDLATPIVNSVWRVAADAGILADAWQHLGQQTRTATFVTRCGELGDTATRLARGVRWDVVASPEALDRHGVADTAPGMRVVLDAYLLTLPRVLALIASSRAADGS